MRNVILWKSCCVPYLFWIFYIDWSVFRQRISVKFRQYLTEDFNIWSIICITYDDFYIGKTKRRLHDRKTEHFKSLTKWDQSSAIADHVTATGHDIKWDHFEILASGKTDYHCKIKETLFIQDLKPAFNVNISRVKSWCFISRCLILNLISRPLVIFVPSLTVT